MKVEAYLRAQVPNFPIESAVLENAVLSPVFAKPQAMRAISLGENVEDNISDAQWVSALKYALSTMYYSLSGAVNGGSRSEKVGDTSVSVSGYTLTDAERAHFRAMADALRAEIGAQAEVLTTKSGGMFDASTRRVR